ncbi:MAG: hypothetical protein E6K97_04995 [Thaumarchaeota archaeon]|nr:MAG: hypothetical protein E6K97_04995 [Nitrososphaerota archaeon]
MKSLILVATFALSLVIAYPMMSLAQQEPETGSQSSSGSQIEVPLNFTLKAKGGEKAKEGQENKSITVDVTIQQGEGGSPTKVPVTAEVSNNTKMQDVQLCSSMKEGKESCQSLKDFIPKQNQSSSGSSEESSKGSNNATDNGNNKGNGGN